MLKSTGRLSLLILVALAAILYGQDSHNITEVGRLYNKWDAAYDIMIIGDLAYLATGFSGLQIVDISNPDYPEVEGYWDDNPGKAFGIYVEGDIAYVADDTCGLRIVDISNMSDPVEISFILTESHSISVVVSGDHAFLADDLDGMNIINVEDPASPREVSRVATRGNVKEIVVSGDLAYLADDLNGLTIVDISNLAEPEIIGGINFGFGQAKGIFINDNYIYVANGPEGIEIVDITDPTRPIHVSNCEINGWAWDIYVENSFAYVASQVGLSVVDISNPAHLNVMGEYESPGFARDVCVVGDFAYCADFWAGLRIVNVSDLENIEENSCFDTHRYFCDIKVVDDLLYTINSETNIDSKLKIIDVSDPEDPTEVGCIETRGEAKQLDVEDNFAYIADGSEGLSIFEVSDPEHPEEAGHIDLRGTVNDVDVVGDFAYIVKNGDIETGLCIVNISQPNHPQRVGFEDLGGPSYSLIVRNQTAFVTIYWDVLRLINIQDPGQPSINGAVQGFSRSRGIDVVQNVTYIADELLGLRIFNTQDPRNPEEMYRFDTPGLPYDVQVSNNFAYVADFWSGIRVLDIHNPWAPVEVAYFDTPGRALSIKVVDNLIYVADFTNIGIYQFNPVPLIVVNTNRIAFGDIQVSDLAEYSLTVNNHGNSTLNISNISIEGVGFNIAFDQEIAIEPRDTHEFNLVFAPDSIGVFGGLLTIESNDEENPVLSIPLSGIGVERIAVVSTDSIRFGVAQIDQELSSDLFISNAGNSALQINQVYIESEHFSATYDERVSIQPDSTFTLEITFSAADTGEYSADLEIYTNDINHSVFLIPLLASVEDSTENAPGEALQLPAAFKLLDPYPSPFNSTAHIPFEIPRHAEVVIAVYDGAGHQIENIWQAFTSPGKHTIQWNADHMPTGMYFIQMKSGNYLQTRKVVLTR